MTQPEQPVAELKITGTPAALPAPPAEPVPLITVGNFVGVADLKWAGRWKIAGICDDDTVDLEQGYGKGVKTLNAHVSLIIDPPPHMTSKLEDVQHVGATRPDGLRIGALVHWIDPERRCKKTDVFVVTEDDFSRVELHPLHGVTGGRYWTGVCPMHLTVIDPSRVTIAPERSTT